LLKQPVDNAKIPEIARDDGLVRWRAPDISIVVGIHIRELGCVEFRYQDDLPGSFRLPCQDIAKLRGRTVEPMHGDDNAPIADGRLRAKEEDANRSAHGGATVRENKGAQTFVQPKNAHLVDPPWASVHRQ